MAADRPLPRLSLSSTADPVPPPEDPMSRATRPRPRAAAAQEFEPGAIEWYPGDGASVLTDE